MARRFLVIRLIFLTVRLNQEICVRKFKDLVCTNGVYTRPESVPFNIPAIGIKKEVGYLFLFHISGFQSGYFPCILSDEGNSQFFQERMLIECIGYPAWELVMVQVPVIVEVQEHKLNITTKYAFMQSVIHVIDTLLAFPFFSLKFHQVKETQWSKSTSRKK